MTSITHTSINEAIAAMKRHNQESISIGTNAVVSKPVWLYMKGLKHNNVLSLEVIKQRMKKGRTNPEIVFTPYKQRKSKTFIIHEI